MLKRLLVNIGSNFSVVAVYMILTFIMTPIYVDSLGDYDYGLWIMIVSVIGYMGILDMGIRPAISRFAAKYLAEGDQRALHILYSTAFLFLFLMGVLLAIIFFVWAMVFPETIAPKDGYADKYLILLLLLGCRMLISFPGYVAESYLEGFQEYALKNNIAICNTVIASLCFIYFVDNDNGLVLIAALTTIEISLKFLFYMLILYGSAKGKISFHLSDYSPVYLKEILVFGMKSLIQGIATRVENSTDTLIVGFVLGPAVVPFYSIPANLIGYVRTVAETITHAFMPLFSSLHASNRGDDVVRIYLGASKYTVAMIFPLLIGVMVVGGPFINIWIDPKYGDEADMIIIVLSFYIALRAIDPMKGRYLTALNKHGFMAKVSPISAVMNLVLSIILVHTHGLIGVALGSLLPMFFFAPLYTAYTCKQLDIKPIHYLSHSVFPIIFPLISMGLAIMYFRIEYGLESYWQIIQCVIVGVTVYAPLFLIFSLTPEDRSLLYRLYSK